MQKNKGGLFTLAGCLLALTAGAAHADVKVVQTSTLANVQYAAMRDSMTAQQRAAAHREGMDLMMGIPQVSTIFASGPRFRLDIGSTSVLYDLSANTQTTINKTKKTFSSASTLNALSNPGAFQVTVIPAKKHSKILGHPASEYYLKATSVSFPGMVMSGQVWSADDIKRPNLPLHGILAQMSAVLQQLKGLPLVVNLKATGTSAGETDFNSKVTSISQTNLPASTFKVPAGYKAADPNAAPASPLAAMGSSF